MRSLTYRLLVAALSLTGIAHLRAQAPATAAESLPEVRIEIESVSGRVRYGRGGRFRLLSTSSRLKQADTLIADAAALCKLIFRDPETDEVRAATIVEGYTEMVIAQAVQGASLQAQLDVRQGVVRAGVVQTAVPPSFQIRDPRVVAAVRGTEIAELESSYDLGTTLRMGRVGVASVRDATPLSRSAQARQGTRKRVEPTVRASELLRAIENAILSHRVTLLGPHRAAMEIAFERENRQELIEFSPAEFFKSEGNPAYQRRVYAEGDGLLGGGQGFSP